ncbi:MAG: acyl carrier protein [Bryobacteraceae bacterium]
MNPASANDVKKAIRDRIAEIAKTLGNNARSLKDDDVIPEASLLDSAGIMELIMWYEAHWDLSIPQQDLTIENFGTVDAMAAYLRQAGK